MKASKMRIVPMTAILTATIITWSFPALTAAEQPQLRRAVADKPTYRTLPEHLNTNSIIFKLREDIEEPIIQNQRFQKSGQEWDRLNAAIAPTARASAVGRHFPLTSDQLDRIRIAGTRRTGVSLPSLNLYYEVTLGPDASNADKLTMISQLNALDIVEIAYFPAPPVLAGVATPGWEAQQFYLQPAPTGVDAYYAWSAPGGKGDNVKVIDIEGNWIQTHEDLHGGTDNFHIAGAKINDPGWWNHGTAVLGEIAADSNSFGMTGIAFNVDLGTVSIGSMSIASALITAMDNSDTGDVILIELQISGPNNGNYVPVEYEQATFDAILTVSASNRIVVEAGANGAQNLDDTNWYGSLFDPDFRFSGAIMVAASDENHVPASFTSYGQRLDVHAFGTWNVFTLGYGDLYGSTVNDYYTGSFSGTSSASPIIVGATACLQSISKQIHGRVMDHTALRTLLQDYSTPQAPSFKHIGPLPDLAGSVDQVVGVALSADVTFGWVPVAVNFTGSSGLQVDTWTWDFGDSDSAFVQSPAHAYTSPGMFDVSLEIDAAGDIRRSERPDYIIALADSLISSDTAATRGSRIEIEIYARNSVPIREFLIPVEFAGTLSLTLDSFSTVGCRTDYFEEQVYQHYDAGNKKVTVRLRSSSNGTSPDLDPGTGPVLRLHFRISGIATDDQSATISLAGYSIRVPEFTGYGLEYEPITAAGTVSICPLRGDINGQGGVNVADLSYLVDYLFNFGPPPVSEVVADVDCSGGVNVADLSYMVDYLFLFGPPPCTCP